MATKESAEELDVERNKSDTSLPLQGIQTFASNYKHNIHKPCNVMSNVLVIYTGGTIGMVSENGVYQPKSNSMVPKLRTLSIFNSSDEDETVHPVDSDGEDLLMLQINGAHGRRLAYKVIEFEPLLDSSNMDISDWIKIARCIKDNYDDFDGFVVLHGTDTMAYTASALSFMMENLGKPVILTGSQIPLYETRSDGRDNFLGSLIIAGTYAIPEVMICFNERVFRGNRCIKSDADSFSAFDSPNMNPLVKLQIEIKVDYASIFRSGSTEKFDISTTMCPNVGLLRLFPGITIQTVRAFLQPPVQGVVLQTYGGGNAPNNRPDFLQLFKEAINWGVIIINISQCAKGNVGKHYATGMALAEVGVILGGDMTPEAALTKLAYVLGKDKWSIDVKRKMMGRSLRGELTTVGQPDLHLTDVDLIDSVARFMSLSSKEEIVKVKEAIYPCLMYAAAKADDIPALEKLRVSGAHLGALNQDGRTPLHVAARDGHINTVHYLLNHGVSVHVRDCRQDTPLIDAVSGKHFDIIRLLVQTGAIVTLSNTEVSFKMCSLAAENDVEGIRAWLLAGANPNCQDYDKRAPLHVAVNLGSFDVAKLLLSSGADADLSDIFGYTPRSIALQLQQQELINIMGEEPQSHS